MYEYVASRDEIRKFMFSGHECLGAASSADQFRLLQSLRSPHVYIQKGGVRLSVVNEAGKEAVVAVLAPGDFFGEGCLAGQPIRIGTATAITPTAVLVIEKKEMIRVLHHEHALSGRFITYMLSRNIRIEEDLVDQLFNPSEKRLTRTLLLLARYGTEDKPQRVLPKVSRETLAEMVGTVRNGTAMEGLSGQGVFPVHRLARRSFMFTPRPAGRACILRS